MIKKLLLCMFVFSTSILWAQAPGLDECIATALENNADLQKQAIILEQARKESANQWNNFLPSLTLSADYSNTAHQLSPTTSAGNWGWGASASLGLTSLSFNIPTEMKIAALDYDIALNTYQQLTKSIETQVASAYYQLLESQENIVALEESLTLAENEYAQVRRRYNVGAASELDLLMAQYSFESAEPALRTAQNTYRNQIVAFFILLGTGQDMLLPFASSRDGNESENFQIDTTLSIVELRFPDLSTLIENHVEYTADVISATYTLERSKLSSLSTKLSSYAPTISISENLQFSESASGNNLSATGTFSISARLPIENFIPGSTVNLNVQKTEDAITTAEINLNTAKETVRRDIYEKVLAIEKLWKDIATAELSYSIAERAYELSQEAYQNGLLDQTDLETARQNYTGANLDLIACEISYINGAYALANTLNIHIDELYALYGQSSTVANRNLLLIGEING
ncbi:MAG: TolC family protein [Spirochaetales bacterium]